MNSCSFHCARKLTVRNHFKHFLFLWFWVRCTIANCYIIQGVGPQEYSLIKMKLKEPYPAKLQYAHCLHVVSQSILMFCILLLLVWISTPLLCRRWQRWGHQLVWMGWQSIRIVSVSACVIFSILIQYRHVTDRWADRHMTTANTALAQW